MISGAWPRWRRSSLSSDAGLAAVVVGGLDQQSAGVAGAGFGDRPLAALLAAGVFGGDDPDVGGELVGVVEAVKLADLGAQPERGERVDPAQAPQPADCAGERRVGRERRELLLDPVAAGDQYVVGVQVVGDRQLRGAVGEPQAREPFRCLSDHGSPGPSL